MENTTTPEAESDDSEMDFSKPWDLSDVTFLVEEKKLYANKVLLSIWSPVMKAMFYHDFKEKASTEVELPGKKYKDIDELMKVLYPPNKPVDGSQQREHSALSGTGVPDVNITKKCEQFLLNKPPSLASLILADEYSLTGLQKVCMDYTKTRSFGQLKSESGFEDLFENTKITILLDLLEKQSPILEIVEKIQSQVKSVECSSSSGKCENTDYSSHSAGDYSFCLTCTLWCICEDLKPLKH